MGTPRREMLMDDVFSFFQVQAAQTLNTGSTDFSPSGKRPSGLHHIAVESMISPIAAPVP